MVTKMKNKIFVPVGSDPVIKKYRNTEDEYIDYGYKKVFSPTYKKLADLVKELTEVFEEYSDTYQDIQFREENLCGCYNPCDCSSTYVLYGYRMESDLEYNFRIKMEEKRKKDREEQERITFENLKKKYENT